MKTTMQGFHYTNTTTHHSGQSNHHGITLLVSDTEDTMYPSGHSNNFKDTVSECYISMMHHTPLAEMYLHMI